MLDGSGIVEVEGEGCAGGVDATKAQRAFIGWAGAAAEHGALHAGRGHAIGFLDIGFCGPMGGAAFFFGKVIEQAAAIGAGGFALAGFARVPGGEQPFLRGGLIINQRDIDPCAGIVAKDEIGVGMSGIWRQKGPQSQGAHDAKLTPDC